MIPFLLLVAGSSFCIFFVSHLFLRRWLCSRRHPNSVAFFHPECDGLGGGERVLWCIVKTLLTTSSTPEARVNAQFSPTIHENDGEVEVVVYSSVSSRWSPKECLEKVKERFGIELLPWLRDNDNRNTQNVAKGNRLRFVPLRSTQLIDPHLYPRFTLLFQTLGSMIVAAEAVIRYTPLIFIDTTGHAFTLVLASALACCRVCSYIHYPTISTDMIKVVKNRCLNFNNAPVVTQSFFISSLKVAYYTVFAWCYGLCGGFMESCVVNSSWTYSHIADLMTKDTPVCHKLTKALISSKTTESLQEVRSQLSNSSVSNILRYSPLRRRFENFASHCFKCLVELHRLPHHKLSLVYPPCDIKAFMEAAKPLGSRVCRIVSVSQFRPEKNHELQLEVMAKLLQLYKSKSASVPKELELVICGAVRSLQDQVILDRLKARSTELGLGERVRFEVNLDFNKLKELLGSSKIGLHTMVDEHFGIALVEFLASGLLVVAHDSAGPRIDILNISPLVLLANSISSTKELAHGERCCLTSRSDDEADDVVMLETPRRGKHDDDYVAATFGYLCHTADGFARALYQCLSDSEESTALLNRIPSSLKRFNDNNTFGKKCIAALDIARLLQDNVHTR